MNKKVFILVSCLWVFAISLRGQCPDRNVLWKRLLYLKDSARLPARNEQLELFGYASKIQNCPYKNDSTHAYVLRRIAKLYADQGEYLNAVQYLHQSIRITSSNASRPSVRVRDLVMNYYWLSVYYDSLNNAFGKIRAADSCIDIAMKLRIPSDFSCVRAFFTRVEYFFDMGDYHRCIENAEMCEKLAREYVKSTNDKRNILAGTSVAESSLGWKMKALLTMGDYTALEDFLTNKVLEYKSEKLKDYLGFAYGQLAEVQEQKGDFSKALFYLTQSLKCYEEIGDNFNCKQTVKEIGNCYIKHFGDVNKALFNYKKAVRYVNTQKQKASADTFELLDIYRQMANIYVRNNRFDSAFHYFQVAFDQIKPGISEAQILSSSLTEFMRNKKVNYLTGLFIDKSDAFKQQYKIRSQRQTIRNAIYSYKQADQLLDRTKAEQTDLDSKLFWRSDSRHLYENAIEACYLAGDIDNAFYFFEKSRAVLLQDQLNEQKWLGETDIMKQAQLNKEILQLERELKDSAKSSKHYSEVENEWFAAKQKLENVKEVIKATNPLYYQSFVNSDSISITGVRKKILKDHDALVELFAGDSAIYLLTITRQNSYLQKINRTVFYNLSTAYVSYLSNADMLNRELNSFIEISHQLYQAIFQGVKLPAGRIIISPDGRYFPFESLITSTRPQTYFVQDYAVSYTYSARYLLNNFHANSNSKTRTFFGVAPVTFKNGLAELSGSDESLKRIGASFSNATNFVGSKATKDNFLKEYYHYKIVQLYTHATDSGSSGDPLIYFFNSILSLSDLFYEKKPASSLIVLSACETAGGKLYNGEGVFSFNRQFAALGIPSSVSNLWQADNQSSYHINELFYKYLAAGLPMDVALQSAKKKFMKSSNLENKLPYYWAAPILVGQSGNIELPGTFPWRWATAVGVLAILTVGGWQARKRRIQKRK